MSAWVKRGSDIDGEAAYDHNGMSVSLSSDELLLLSGHILMMVIDH